METSVVDFRSIKGGQYQKEMIQQRAPQYQI